MQGRLFGVGVGPGDPELMSVKAVKLIGSTVDIAYFAARGRPSNARRTAADLLTDDHVEHRIEYPVTVEVPVADKAYETLLIGCYDEAAGRLEHVLAGNRRCRGRRSTPGRRRGGASRPGRARGRRP